MPGIAIARIVHALEGAQLITVTEDEHLLPARDLGNISIQEILDIARNEKAGQVGWRNIKLPAIDAISARDGRGLAQELRRHDAAGSGRTEILIRLARARRFQRTTHFPLPTTRARRLPNSRWGSQATLRPVPGTPARRNP